MSTIAVVDLVIFSLLFLLLIAVVRDGIRLYNRDYRKPRVLKQTVCAQCGKKIYLISGTDLRPETWKCDFIAEDNVTYKSMICEAANPDSSAHKIDDEVWMHKPIDVDALRRDLIRMICER